MSLLSYGAYARSKGWSQQYISKLVKGGKLPVVNGMIDPVMADEALARQSEPNRAGVVVANAQKRKRRPTENTPTEDAPPLGSGRYVETPLSRAKTADAVYTAKSRQMEYEHKIGRLCEVSEVDRAIADLCGPAVAALSGIADRLSARVAAETDPRKCYAMMDAEIDTARRAIADFARALAERLTATQQ